MLEHNYRWMHGSLLHNQKRWLESGTQEGNPTAPLSGGTVWMGTGSTDNGAPVLLTSWRNKSGEGTGREYRELGMGFKGC